MIFDVTGLFIGSAAGAAVGGLYFWGLWVTVRRLPRSHRPGLWMLGSLILRTTLAVVSFWAVSQGSWARFCGCLLGFVAVRMIAVRRIRRQQAADSRNPSPSRPIQPRDRVEFESSNLKSSNLKSQIIEGHPRHAPPKRCG